jgi:TonB family protein
MWHNKLKLLLVTLLQCICGNVLSQSQLLECQGSDYRNWSNCFGFHTTVNGNKYFGEWKNGKFNGQGIISYTNGDVTEGIWQDGTFVRAEKTNLQPSMFSEKGLKDTKQLTDEEKEKERANRMARLRVQAGIEDGVNTTPSFSERVRRVIKPKIVFNPEKVEGNPALSILVELAPDGRIINKRITKASGEPDWDNAVIRALDKVDSLPKDENGNVPRQVNLIFRPKN